MVYCSPCGFSHLYPNCHVSTSLVLSASCFARHCSFSLHPLCASSPFSLYLSSHLSVLASPRTSRSLSAHRFSPSSMRLLSPLDCFCFIALHAPASQTWRQWRQPKERQSQIKRGRLQERKERRVRKSGALPTRRRKKKQRGEEVD